MLEALAPARVLAPLAAAGPLVLAVSGGPDSIALMLLAAQWQQRPQGFTVATVDHGLRAGSADEASQVGRWARAAGFAHATLSWTGARPKTRIQEMAREMRYRLLLDHAAGIGASGIVTAHHADDQAETVLFRLTKGSGPAGLAAMRPKMQRGPLVHWRPLLDVPKQALVECCQANGHPYLDDPSNRNEAYARTGLRRLAPLLATAGLDRAALLRLARRAVRAESALETRVDELVAAWAVQNSPGRFEADAAFLALQPQEFVLRLLARAIAGVTDARVVIRLDRLEDLTQAVCAALAGGGQLAATLAGAVIRLGRDGHLSIAAEPPRRRGR